MSDHIPADLPKELDLAAAEERCRALWEDSGIYRFAPASGAAVFSVDTPPPYVSAAHLHVGHAMSYAQAEFIVRYQRMQGRNVFYPMGFDDNGLPTERFVEKTYGINKRQTTRKEFRALCLEETRKGAAEYEKLWRALGLSVDWRLRYSTIDDHCRATAQKSFLDLYRGGRLARLNEPVLWDTHFETALAQADLESLPRRGKLHAVAFQGGGGRELVISTTRPELIPACVALYCHPSDERYRGLAGTPAVVPLFGYEVPVLADEEVEAGFGTGLMMVCTFGDGEDVRRWKRDGLATRLCIGPAGRLLPLAGPYAGLTVAEARARILADLQAAGLHRGETVIEQTVSVAERSGVPIEFVMAPQWFVRVLDLKDEMLARSAELRWFPAWMKIRLDQWIQGLRFDWNISRQRFYGVPFPVWYCGSCGDVILAREEHLPVDPLEDPPPVAACPACGGGLHGDPDVMDTWMTSSVTPLINANWVGSAGRLGGMDLHPMTARMQAFEIIRTWLFYTLVKSHLHCGTLPWRDVMISGWGLTEQGKKISKRDLEPGKDGRSRYDPYRVIQEYGADALRYWAAGSHLGHDTRYNEKDVKAGRKLVVKLWNAARLVVLQLAGFDPAAPRPPVAGRTAEDRWVISELNRILATVQEGFESYDYAVARETTDRFFWSVFCDDYLEMVKDRFWNLDRHTPESRLSAQATMWEALRTILGLYAPFLPFITEELYQRLYRPTEGAVSLHVTSFPAPRAEHALEVPEMALVTAILRTVRALRTEQRASQTRPLAALVLEVDRSDLRAGVSAMMPSIQAVARAAEVRFGQAATESGIEGIRVDIVTAPVAVG
jgi:valyl-tRNA synthetase